MFSLENMDEWIIAWVGTFKKVGWVLAASWKILPVQEAIDTPTGKKINKMIKESKIKAQSSIMENKVRVTAKKIDDLRAIMAMAKIEYSFKRPFTDWI